MLSERAQQLLSGYVDGALTRIERDSVESLLRESAEAREFLVRLQQNAQRIRSLPRHSLRADFAQTVVSRLPRMSRAPVETTLADPLIRKPKLRRGMPAWQVAALCGCVVLMLVGGGLFLLHDHVDFDKNLLPGVPTEAPMVKVKPHQRKTPTIDTAVVDLFVAQVVRGASENYIQPPPTVEPIVVPSAQPVRFTFGDLQRTTPFDSLKWELAQNEAVHLDVTVKSHPRSLNRLVETFTKHGINLAVAPPSQATLQKKQPLLIYAQNVSPDRLAQMLKELGEADIQGQRREPTTYQAVQLASGSHDDERQVARGLGIDPTQLKAGTGGQGMYQGVVLPHNADGSSTAANDVREFLATRRAPQPGTLQVFVTLLPND